MMPSPHRHSLGDGLWWKYLLCFFETFRDDQVQSEDGNSDARQLLKWRENVKEELLNGHQNLLPALCRHRSGYKCARNIWNSVMPHIDDIYKRTKIKHRFCWRSIYIMHNTNLIYNEGRIRELNYYLEYIYISEMLNSTVGFLKLTENFYLV